MQQRSVTWQILLSTSGEELIFVKDDYRLLRVTYYTTDALHDHTTALRTQVKANTTQKTASLARLPFWRSCVTQETVLCVGSALSHPPIELYTNLLGSSSTCSSCFVATKHLG